jgi:hypothetical protein
MTGYGVKTLYLKAELSVTDHILIQPLKRSFPEKVSDTKKNIHSEITRQCLPEEEMICRAISKRDGISYTDNSSKADEQNFINGARKRSIAVFVSNFTDT